MISRSNSLEIGRFIFGGFLSLAVCYTALYIIVEILGVHYLIAANLAMVITYCFSYTINKYLVFRDRTKQHLKQGIRFVLLQVVLALLANFLLYIQVSIVGINYFIAVVLLGPPLAIMNYALQKIAIFKVA